MKRYIGIDAGKTWADACFRTDPNTIIHECRFRMTVREGKRFARRLTAEDKVVLEATTNAWWLYDILRESGAEVLVSNPKQTKAIAQAKVKTDKVDARVLSQLLATGFVATVWVPPKHIRQARSLVAHYEHVSRQVTRLKNKIHALLTRHQIVPPAADIFTPKFRPWLESLALEGTEAFELQSSLRLLDLAMNEREQTRKQLAALAYDNPVVHLLLQLPGVGTITAVVLWAEIGDIERFPTPEKLCGYSGLVPSVHQSGNTAYMGPITKEGRKRIRWILVEAAYPAAQADAELRRFFRRIQRKKGTNKAKVAVARKLLRIVWAVWHGQVEYARMEPITYQRKLVRLARQTPKSARTSTTRELLERVMARWGKPALTDPHTGEALTITELMTGGRAVRVHRAHSTSKRVRASGEQAA